MTSMTIIDTKERALWPFFMLTVLRFHNIQDDWYSIFVIVSHKTLVSIGSICSNYTVSLHTAFCRFMIGNYNSGARLQGQFLSLIIFISIMYHLIDIESSKWLHFSLYSCLRIYLLSHIHISSICFKECLQVTLCHNVLLWFMSLICSVSTRGCITISRG